MTCQACTAALRAPRIDKWEPGCDSCLARALAATGAHVASKAAGRMLPEYIAVLKGLFADRWKAGGELVKQWVPSVERAKV